MRKNKMNAINTRSAKLDEVVEPNNKDEKLNNDLNPNLLQINGPLNVVRLEGTIGEIKKVIYLFFDFHMDLHLQTKCTNIYSKDVNMFFAESFYELNKMDKKYDFFMEIRPRHDIYESKMDSIKKKKEIYIGEMMTLFSTIFQYDETKNQVNVSDHLKNVRLHYLDIRDYIQHHIINFFNEALSIANQIMFTGHAHVEQLDKIIEVLKIQREMLDTTINIFMDPESILIKEKKPVIQKVSTTPYTPNIEPEIIANLSAKIKNKYNHSDVQKKINIIFNDIIDQLKKVSNNITAGIDFINYIIPIVQIPWNDLVYDSITQKYFYGVSGKEIRQINIDIFNICEDIHTDMTFYFVRLTDIYFLRRFLDKDYVTNGIVFSGAAHSLDYIEYLVKYFDFKITHVAYALDKNIDELNKETKERLTDNETITDIFYPPKLYQCSDITHFPKNFA